MKTPSSKWRRRLTAALIVAVAFTPAMAMAAGSTADDMGLNEILEWLVDLVRGPLGKVIAITAFIVGIIAGIAVGRFTAILTGAGFAIVCYYGPSFLLRIFGAGL